MLYFVFHRVARNQIFISTFFSYLLIRIFAKCKYFSIKWNISFRKNDISNMCLTCSALSWRGLCARLKRVLSTNRDNSAVRSKHVFCVCAESLYRSSQDGESDYSYLISFFFSFFSSTLHYFSFIFILFLISLFYLFSINFDFTFLHSISFLFLFNTPLFI